MLKNSAKMMFSLILMFGTLLTISSNSWIGSWMGLEINLLAFIPLMTSTNNLMSSESSMKYFLIQALASSVLLFSVTLMLMKFNIQNSTIHYYSIDMMLMSSLLMKSGAAPFHFWFPGVMEGLSWMTGFFLMTWQKIAPLILISYVFTSSLIFFVPIILSVTIGSLGGLNQTSLRKLMAFSSINHIGWMLSAMLADELLWLFYFSMYSFLSLALIMMFNWLQLFHFNQLFSMNMNSQTLKFFLFMNLLSLGGLPPFMGFMPKWLVIQFMTFNNQYLLMFSITVFTLITLFFYMRMTYSAFTLSYYETNWNKIYINNLKTYVLLSTSLISLFGLPLMSLIFFVI